MNGVTEIEENMWELFFAPDLISCRVNIFENRISKLLQENEIGG